MIAFGEAKLAFSDGFTSTHLLDLEADVEYMIVVATAPGANFDPDFLVDSSVTSVMANAETDADEEIRFTAGDTATHMLSIDIYGCMEDECAYAFAVYRAQ